MKTILLVALLFVAASVAQADGEIALKGTFNRGKEADNKPLTAVLTPAGKDTWKIAYQAEWKGKMLTYNGALTGNIKDGTFTGTGTRDGKRTWVIEGKATGGKLTFDHFETTKGGKARTGSAKLE